MANFTTIKWEGNDVSTASPTWVNLSAAGTELRFSDVSSIGLATASASWPGVTRPVSGVAAVDYHYLFSADAVGNGLYGGAAGAAPAIWALTQYLSYRLNWDNVGTFGSAPIVTAYPSTAHGTVTRGDASMLGGHASDTGGTARSYLKGAMWGRVTSAGAPGAGPGGAPAATDGTTGSVGPTAGANWSAFQSLQGANDFLTFPSTPAAVTADTLYVMLREFIGANLATGAHVPVVSCSYTYV